MTRFILAFLIIFASPVSFAELIPVEAFFKNPGIGSLKLSPDGKHFAATVNIKGDKKLVILDVKTKEFKYIFSFSQGYREIGSFGWFNNERIYAEMVRKVGPLSQGRRTGYLFAGNIDGSNKGQILPRPKTPGRTSESAKNYRIVNELPNEHKHVLISMWDGKFQKTYKLNTYTGARTTYEKSPIEYGELVLDHNGTARAIQQNHPDDKMFRIFLRNDGKSKWELFKEFDAKKVGMSVADIAYDFKSLLINVRNTNVKRGIYRLNLNTKDFSFVKKIPGDSDVENYLYHYDVKNENYELIGFRQMPGYIEDTYIDDKHEGVIFRNSLKESFPGQIVDLINDTRDGRKTLIRTWSDVNPGTYYLFDNITYKMEYLFDSNDSLNSELLAPMEPISFKARDGMEIRGYLTRPLGNKKKNLPLVVYVHGGPYGPKDEWGYNYSNRDTQFLANRGYAVLQINYRGSGGRGSKFQYDAYLKMGAEMQDDLTDGTMWAINNGIADKERICIYGASYGGYAAMMGIIREPELYKCSIPYVGVYDIKEWNEADTWDSKNGREFVREAWGYDDEKFVDERSPSHNVSKIKAAIFLVHGKKDPRVPISHYYSLTKALNKINYPFESLVKPFEGHGFRNEENNYELYTKIEAFLKKHIGN